MKLSVALRKDKSFFDIRPHHVAMPHLRVTLRDTLRTDEILPRAYPELAAWIDRYAEMLERAFEANADELAEIASVWRDTEAAPSGDGGDLHAALVALAKVRHDLAHGEYRLSPGAYALPRYEQQRALALSVARSWCIHNGISVPFDGLAVDRILSNGPIDWRQAACAPFLAPTGGGAYPTPSAGEDLVCCLTGDSMMPINFGYPLPPAVFEDYARLCYRKVLREQYPNLARSERYSAYSNLILAWYFQKGLSISEISRRLGIAKSTTQRQLEQLIDLYNRDLPSGGRRLAKRTPV